MVNPIYTAYFCAYIALMMSIGVYYGSPYVPEAVAGYVSSLLVLVAVSLATGHSPDEQVKAAYFDPLHVHTGITHEKGGEPLG